MNYQLLERTIGHTFSDIGLLDLAMTHPSYALSRKCQDNQRLEFLGDAVLEICVSRVLYRDYPKLREGQLTRKRAALVCEANLARAAKRLGLGSFLKLDRGEELVGGRENPSILADTMEDAIETANEIASEHLEIVTRNPFEVMTKIRNAGAIFLGEYSSEPLGDYFAGPNHVLPTNGTAKFFSPLGVDDFIKRSSIIYYSREALKPLSEDIIKFANTEHLTAHANSIRVRFEEDDHE